MALDTPRRPNGYRPLELGERTQLPPNHETETFDLSTLIKRSLEEKKVFELRVNTGLDLNALKVVVIDGKAFVIQANGSFDGSTYNLTHILSVDNRTGTLDLKPMMGGNFASIRPAEVTSEEERFAYAVELAKKRVVEEQQSVIRKGCWTVMGATALAAALCGGMAYEALSKDQVEEAQKAD